MLPHRVARGRRSAALCSTVALLLAGAPEQVRAPCEPLPLRTPSPQSHSHPLGHCTHAVDARRTYRTSVERVARLRTNHSALRDLHGTTCALTSTLSLFLRSALSPLGSRLLRKRQGGRLQPRREVRCSAVCCVVPDWAHHQPLARSEWTEDGGGFSQFDAAYPSPTVTVRVSSAGPVAFQNKDVLLTASQTMLGTPVDLHASNARLKYYNETLFFQGAMPLFDMASYGPGIVQAVATGAERDQYVSLTPYDSDGTAAAPVTVKVFSCREFTQKVACSALSAPPPPGNWTRQPNAGIFGGHRRRALMALKRAAASPLQKDGLPMVSMPDFVPGNVATAAFMYKGAQQGAPTLVSVAPPTSVSPGITQVSPAMPPPPAATSASTVSLSATSVSSASSPAPAPSSGSWDEWSSYDAASGSGGGAQCVAYFRQVSFLTSLTLVASLSGTNASYTLSEAPQCGATYGATATVPVDKQTFNEDLYPSDDVLDFVPMRWCEDWPAHMAAPPQQPTLVMRGASDPYVVAAEVTQCTYDFSGGGSAAASKAVRRVGDVALLGVAAAALGACALVAYTSRPKVSYSALLRDPPGVTGEMGRSGYGTVAPHPSGAKAMGGDIEVTTFSRQGAFTGEQV